MYRNKTNKYIYKIIKLIINIVYPIYYRIPTNKKGVNEINNKEKIIISLTTFPARIEKIWLCIESLMRQSKKPNEIILWLANEQFNGEKALPGRLLKLKERGLTIRFCEDLKSHKKYYYTIKENPNAVVITVDDDIFYPEDLVENLLNTHYKYPNAICCNLAHEIVFNNGGMPAPYLEWISGSPNNAGPSYTLCPIGCEGILYPPKSLNQKVLDKEVLLNLSPTADDLWLKVMALLNKTPTVKVNKKSITYVGILGSQKESLTSINVNSNKNDIQMKALIDKFDIDFERIKRL